MINLLDLGDQMTTYQQYELFMPKADLPKMQKFARAYYPEKLVHLIERCIQRLPSERIRVEELCACIEREVKELSRAELSEDDRWRFPLVKENLGKFVKLEL